jgi:hypothetical protein
MESLGGFNLVIACLNFFRTKLTSQFGPFSRISSRTLNGCSNITFKQRLLSPLKSLPIDSATLSSRLL